MTQEIAELTSEIKACEDVLHKVCSVSPTNIIWIKQQTLQGADMMTGWSKYAVKVPEEINAYYNSRHHLTMSEGLVLYNDRIVMPDKLQRIHDGHQGIVKSKLGVACDGLE